MALYDDISAAVMKGKKKQVVALVEQALEEGCAAQEILDVSLIGALSVVGEQFSAGEIFVPEMLVAARAMSAGADLLKPYLVSEGAEPVGKAVIGTVKGDMHDIGKNLVRMMVEGKGIEITDLGVDVPAEKFVEYLQENPDCQLLLLSALLTTTMAEIPVVVKAVEEAGLRDQVKIMVGGAPVTQAFADEIGADAYTIDAGAAAIKAVELLTA